MGLSICGNYSKNRDILVIFKTSKLKDVIIIEPERNEDERGFFARIWCQREFKMHGLNTELAQCNISFNKKEGTLRGMHFQTAPNHEVKLVRCTSGAIYDVIIDLRPYDSRNISNNGFQ